jgi:hypothetical protein
VREATQGTGEATTLAALVHAIVASDPFVKRVRAGDEPAAVAQTAR